MTRWHRNSPLAARKGWVAPEDAIFGFESLAKSSRLAYAQYFVNEWQREILKRWLGRRWRDDFGCVDVMVWVGWGGSS